MIRLLIASIVALALSSTAWAGGMQNFTPVPQGLLLKVSAESNFPPAPFRQKDARPHVAACTADAPTCCKIGEAKVQCVKGESECTDMGGTSVATDTPGCNEG